MRCQLIHALQLGSNDAMQPAIKALHQRWGSFLCLSILLDQNPLILFLIVPKLGSIAVQWTVIVWLSKKTLNRQEDRPHTAGALTAHDLNMHESVGISESKASIWCHLYAALHLSFRISRQILPY